MGILDVNGHFGCSWDINFLLDIHRTCPGPTNITSPDSPWIISVPQFMARKDILLMTIFSGKMAYRIFYI